MIEENKRELSNYRIAMALEMLDTAKATININTKTSVNRSYYAIYNAMRAVLALDGFDSKKHSGIIAEFRKLYIKTGVFQSRLSVIISNLFDIRNDCDYEDFFVVSKDDARTQLKSAEEFYNEVSKYLTNRWKDE